jgi:hypothetical protein
LLLVLTLVLVTVLVDVLTLLLVLVLVLVTVLVEVLVLLVSTRVLESYVWADAAADKTSDQPIIIFFMILAPRLFALYYIYCTELSD